MSLDVNGRLYGPRQRNLPLKKFNYNSPIDAVGYANGDGCIGCKIEFMRDSLVMNSFTRPLDLYVRDSGIWCLTTPQWPSLVSLKSFTETETELSLLYIEYH